MMTSQWLTKGTMFKVTNRGFKMEAILIQTKLDVGAESAEL